MLPAMARREKQGALAGRRIAFFGEFAIWPSYHLATPAEVARRLGATIAAAVDEDLDCLVLGDLRGTGRAEAKKKAERLAAKAKSRLQILDEAAFRELVRIDLAGKSFAFAGGFDCSPGGLEDGLLAGMVAAVGAKVVDEVTETLDYLAVGNRRGTRKIAILNQAKKLIEAGAPIKILDETGFLELVRSDKPRPASGELDFPGFISQLYGTVNEGKLGRALTMLKTDSFKLYSRLDEAHLVGVVRSQSGSGSVYASWLRPDGKYGCSQPDLEDCMGLQGSVCKHLLVLLVGLSRAGQMSAAQALAWVRAARGKGPGTDTELCAETFLQYKGAEAGEVDWRPTSTIPEDFYAV
jgi:hypothetical protein